MTDSRYTRYLALQDIAADIPLAPKLTLMPDGRFNFVYSSLSSYLNYGKYEITGTEYKMVRPVKWKIY
jgi:hypothetical protein